MAASSIIQANKITIRYLGQTYTTLSEQEKMTFLNKESSRFSILPSLLITQPIPEPFVLGQLYQNELSLKGMVLEDQRYVLNNIRKSSDTNTLQLYEQWRSNKALIGKQILLPIAKRLTYLDSLQEVTTQLEQQLSRQANSFRNQQQIQAVTTQDISRKLSKGQAAVEFIRFRLYNKKWTDSIMYAALVLVAEDTLIRFVPLFEEKQLQKLLKPLMLAKNSYGQYGALQKLYGGKSMSTPGRLANPLYRLIWEPLEKNLEGIRTITFAPAGLLHRIAFNALGPDGTHLLMDKYELNQVLSTRSIVFPAQLSPKPNSVSIWGDIDYSVPASFETNKKAGASQGQVIDSSMSSFEFYASDTRKSRGGEWKSLPGTRKEIERLGNLFSKFDSEISVESGKSATEENFKAQNGKSSQVFHLATHGFFLPVSETNPTINREQGFAGKSFNLQSNPMFRSGLVLAGGNYTWKTSKSIPGREDGILTAYEVSQMDLGNTELLVLSACETALGDLQGTEGVIGLQRAFRIAGIRQMVISLWRVPDKETTELMTLFYSHWLGGKSVRDALRMAQLKMKEKYPPFYWAAFVVVE